MTGLIEWLFADKPGKNRGYGTKYSGAYVADEKTGWREKERRDALPPFPLSLSFVVMLYLILADLSYGEVNSFRMSKEDGGHRSGRVHSERFC